MLFAPDGSGGGGAGSFFSRICVSAGAGTLSEIYVCLFGGKGLCLDRAGVWVW